LLQITKKNQKIFIRQNKKWVKFLCKSNNKIWKHFSKTKKNF